MQLARITLVGVPCVFFPIAIRKKPGSCLVHACIFNSDYEHLSGYPISAVLTAPL